MPNRDGTGPEGKRKFTNRNLGNCNRLYSRNGNSGRYQHLRKDNSTFSEIELLKETISEMQSKLDRYSS